jgi:stage V sporulation protein G
VDNFSEIKIRKYDGEGKTKGFASVKVAGVFIVTGITIVEGKDGLFVGMPSKQSKKDSKWYDVAFPASKELREELQAAVLDAFFKEG